MADGSEVFHAISLPTAMSELTLRVASGPMEHLGQLLWTDSLALLATLYRRYLAELVDEAETMYAG